MRYKALDDAIVAFVRKRPKLHPIYSETLAQLAAKELGRDRPYGDDSEWRLIDRRLQALRNGGRIRYVRKPGVPPRWEAATTQPITGVAWQGSL